MQRKQQIRKEKENEMFGGKCKLESVCGLVRDGARRSCKACKEFRLETAGTGVVDDFVK